MTAPVSPLCVCGHLERDHSYRGHICVGGNDCDCWQYTPAPDPSCLCGHPKSWHAGQSCGGIGFEEVCSCTGFRSALWSDGQGGTVRQTMKMPPMPYEHYDPPPPEHRGDHSMTHQSASRIIRIGITLAILLLVVVGLCAIVAAVSILPAQAAAAPSVTACTGVLAKFRADAPAAQLTRAAPISKTTFIVEIPFNQPGWAHACVSGYWIETQYLDLGIANTSSTQTPTLVALTKTPTATATVPPTPTKVTGTQPAGVWITFNGVGQFCPLPCDIQLRSQP